MGFRQGAYATIWEVSPVSNATTQVRLSTSRKNKETGEYEQDFSGFVRFCGTGAAAKALGLKKSSRIKLGDCEVTTRYDKSKGKEYTNYLAYSFEEAESNGGKQTTADHTAPQPTVDEGELDENDTTGRELPF